MKHETVINTIVYNQFQKIFFAENFKAVVWIKDIPKSHTKAIIVPDDYSIYFYRGRRVLAMVRIVSLSKRTNCPVGEK
jgi:hypothetical protein